MYETTVVMVWCLECGWGIHALGWDHGRSLWADHKEHDCEVED